MTDCGLSSDRQVSLADYDYYAGYIEGVLSSSTDLSNTEQTRVLLQDVQRWGQRTADPMVRELLGQLKQEEFMARVPPWLLYLGGAAAALWYFRGRGQAYGHIYPTGSYIPPLSSVPVDLAVRQAVYRFGLPRWWYYTEIAKESSFDPNAFNPADTGSGLAQLTGQPSIGKPYPYNLARPDNTFQQWIFDEGLNLAPAFTGYPWTNMNNVTLLVNEFDPIDNLFRFSSFYAAPALALMKHVYPGRSHNEYLRIMAWHWLRGLPYNAISADYDTVGTNDPYFTLGSFSWDAWRAQFQPATEAQDGVWNGQVFI